MSGLRTAAQQVLEALQNCANGEDDVLLTRDALAALRAALAEPVQDDPVAWMQESTGVIRSDWRFEKTGYVPLYTSPQPQQTEPSQDTPPQHEYEVTANDDGTFSVALPDGEELRIIPPQRLPLTKEEMMDEFCKTPGIRQFVSAFFAGARYAERAHGIGGQDE